MTAAPRARGDEQALLRLAAGGDEGAFGALVEPCRAERPRTGTVPDAADRFGADDRQ